MIRESGVTVNRQEYTPPIIEIQAVDEASARGVSAGIFVTPGSSDGIHPCIYVSIAGRSRALSLDAAHVFFLNCIELWEQESRKVRTVAGRA